jgi:hypothetical protein
MLTTLSFGRQAQSVAVLACLLSPSAGLLRDPHLTPVLLIRRWHRCTATPSTSAMSVWRAFLSRNAPLVGQTLGGPRSNKDAPIASSKGRNLATDYRIFQMRENPCLQVSGVELPRI